MTPPRISKDQEDEVVALYLADFSLRDIARKLGVSTKPVQRVLRLRGVERRPKGRRGIALDPEMVIRLRQAYDAGATLRDLCDRHSLPLDPVRLAIESTGGVRKRGPGPKDFSQAARTAIAQLWNDGKSQLEIASKYACSPQTVDRILSLEGIPVEKRERGGERHWNYQGGRRLNEHGYVMVLVETDDEIGQAMRPQNGYLLESRLVMAHHLGRPLTKHETVHHVNNNDRENNSLENLQLRTGQHGKGAAFRCRACGSIDIEPIDL